MSVSASTILSSLVMNCLAGKISAAVMLDENLAGQRIKLGDALQLVAEEVDE